MTKGYLNDESIQDLLSEPIPSDYNYDEAILDRILFETNLRSVQKKISLHLLLKENC